MAVRLEALLAAGVLPDVKRLREEFAPRKAEVPHVTVEIPPPSAYDALLPSGARLSGWPNTGSLRFQCNNWRFANPALARGWYW